MILVYNLIEKWDKYSKIMAMSLEEIRKDLEEKHDMEDFNEPLTDGQMKDIKYHIKNFNLNSV